MLETPNRQFGPLIPRFAVDGQTQLSILVFWLLEITCHLFDDVCKVFAVQEVIRLEENFTQTRFADGIVFGVEFVKAMESVAVLKMNVR